jgi:hypothetical protein
MIVLLGSTARTAAPVQLNVFQTNEVLFSAWNTGYSYSN